jgi:hypothetical protein
VNVTKDPGPAAGRKRANGRASSAGSLALRDERLFVGRYCLHILLSGKIRVKFQEEGEKDLPSLEIRETKRSRDFQAVEPLEKRLEERRI